PAELDHSSGGVAPYGQTAENGQPNQDRQVPATARGWGRKSPSWMRLIASSTTSRLRARSSPDSGRCVHWLTPAAGSPTANTTWRMMSYWRLSFGYQTDRNLGSSPIGLSSSSTPCRQAR